MPGRTYSSGTLYRYGFNGKENNNEVKGTANELDFGSRIYDPRIARWLSTDPLQKKHANESPYLYTGDNPILFVDPDGRDKVISINIVTDKGTYTLLKITTDYGVYKKTMDYLNILGQVEGVKENTIETYTINLTTRTATNNTPLLTMTTGTENAGRFKTNAISYTAENLGLSNIKLKGTTVQEFGFVEYGGNGTTLEVGGADAKYKELLDLSGILAAAGSSKDLAEGFPDLLGLLDDVMKKTGTKSKNLDALLQLAEAMEKIASGSEATEAANDITGDKGNSNNKKNETKLDPAFYKKGAVIYRREAHFKTKILKSDSTGDGQITDEPATDSVP